MLAIMPVLLLLGTGCGGLNASQGISPLNFLLPGLIQNEKPQEKTAPVAAAFQVPQADTVAQSL